MITITSEENQEKVGIIEKEIVLNGSPSNLQGHANFVNRAKDKLRVRTLALVDNKNKRIKTTGSDALRLAIRLAPGEERLVAVNHQLPLSTAPGTYENYMLLGKEKHKVKMIVQPTINIDIFPTQFTFQDTSPGTKHTAIITLRNLGNLPFQVPLLKHAALLDMDLLCRAFGMGFRENPEGGVEATLSEVTKNIKSNMVDWVAISVDEYGQVVEPGECLMLNVQIEVPKNAKASRDYSGNFRLWDKEISLVVKSHRLKK